MQASRLLEQMPRAHDAVAADVAAAQRGDQKAFTRLLDGHRNLVCSICLALLGGDLDASEEVAQEVFVAAWSGLRQLRNPSSFVPWLREMARNRARLFSRTRARARRRFAFASSDQLAAAVDPARAIPETLIRAEDQRRLLQAVDRLPASAREVVTLYYREGRSVSQVARLLDLQEETVKKRLARARSRLRREVLVELGEALADTGPTAAFTAAVGAALAIGAPAPAAAAPWATTGKLAGNTALAKAGSAVLAALPSALTGAAGVLLWFAKPLWDARPGAERHEVRRLALIAIMHPIGFSAIVGLTNVLPDPTEKAALLGLGWVGFVVSALFTAYLPMMRGLYFQRRAADAATDPQARRRLTWERRFWWIGMAAGMAVGSIRLALLLHWWLA